MLFRALIGVIAALTMLAGPIPTAAHAQRSCYGCNVVDDGRLNQGLVGSTVYYRGGGKVIPVRVLAVDRSTGRLKWQTKDGRTGWGPARRYYTPARSREQSTGIGLGVAAAAVAAVCLAGGCSSKSRDSDRRRYGTRDSSSRATEYQRCRTRCQSQAYDVDPIRDNAGRAACLRSCQ
jgi:hypothetical protein